MVCGAFRSIFLYPGTRLWGFELGQKNGEYYLHHKPERGYGVALRRPNKAMGGTWNWGMAATLAQTLAVEHASIPQAMTTPAQNVGVVVLWMI